MTDITDFIQAAVMDKPIAAQKAFAAALEPRIEDALTAKYDEVSQNVFNPSMESEVEDTDLETEMDDNDV